MSGHQIKTLIFDKTEKVNLRWRRGQHNFYLNLVANSNIIFDVVLRLRHHHPFLTS